MWVIHVGEELTCRKLVVHFVLHHRWFLRYVIAAMLVDENKRFLISSFCSSTSNCILQHCYLCPWRLVANHLLYENVLRRRVWSWDLWIEIYLVAYGFWHGVCCLFAPRQWNRKVCFCHWLQICCLFRWEKDGKGIPVVLRIYHNVQIMHVRYLSLTNLHMWVEICYASSSRTRRCSDHVLVKSQIEITRRDFVQC